MTTRPAAIKEFSDAILRLKWAVQDARLSVAERRELDNSITDLEVAHAERLRVALEPDPVQPQPPSYQALVAAVAELHQHALAVVGNGQLVKLIHAAHMAALEYAVATRWAPPTDKWSAAARAVMERTTPAEGTPVAPGSSFLDGFGRFPIDEARPAKYGVLTVDKVITTGEVVPLPDDGNASGLDYCGTRCCMPAGHDGSCATLNSSGLAPLRVVVDERCPPGRAFLIQEPLKVDQHGMPTKANSLVALDLSDCEDVP